ncbi:GNAT family N-acetyltransferase [Taibaiella lutea]|uniref:GNAT family N-acetyltransferase n=1 Tax=Taibaiella lutea TaxID=2608001 RepID=A0A5M6CQ37_9BACT|nr:GNAT family N-acetyltransferase [Taibaiella lutea]KAA5537106.1 GNAT family N-acetyltransferase [Taibaiella lutea]
MEILLSQMTDIDTIFELYDDAIAFQKQVSTKQWRGFERALVETEIQKGLQYKIIINGAVACIFAIAYNDEIFWGAKDLQPSIYLHRIVTNPTFRGHSFVKVIIEWAKEYCKENNRQFIRMDTWGDNQRLIDYYITCGFEHTETILLSNTEGLPAHYTAMELALFEIEVI